jgi:cytochrome c-type biogenesis protein CcmE
MIETQHRARSRGRLRLTGRQIKLLVGGIIVALTVGYLVFDAARSSVAYYMTVEELVQQGPSQRDVRVAGTIVGGSIAWEPRDLRLAFEIADQSGRLPVLYHGSRPDMFRDGAEAVIEGRYTSKGLFEARTILLKCPSKYEGEG